jgi:hypothetical protein
MSSNRECGKRKFARLFTRGFTERLTAALAKGISATPSPFMNSVNAELITTAVSRQAAERQYFKKSDKAVHKIIFKGL